MFSSNRDGSQGLWRMPASGAQSPRRVPLAGEEITFPAFSRSARRLMYAQRFQDGNLWSLSLPESSGAPATDQVAGFFVAARRERRLFSRQTPNHIPIEPVWESRDLGHCTMTALTRDSSLRLGTAIAGRRAGRRMGNGSRSTPTPTGSIRSTLWTRRAARPGG